MQFDGSSLCSSGGLNTCQGYNRLIATWLQRFNASKWIPLHTPAVPPTCSTCVAPWLGTCDISHLPRRNLRSQWQFIGSTKAGLSPAQQQVVCVDRGYWRLVLKLRSDVVSGTWTETAYTASVPTSSSAAGAVAGLHCTAVHLPNICQALGLTSPQARSYKPAIAVQLLVGAAWHFWALLSTCCCLSVQVQHLQHTQRYTSKPQLSAVLQAIVLHQLTNDKSHPCKWGRGVRCNCLSCREFWRGKLSKGRTSPRSTVNAGSPRNPDRRAPAVVNFKDLNLSVDDELSEDAQVCWAAAAADFVASAHKHCLCC
jgi:hypothetical protein